MTRRLNRKVLFVGSDKGSWQIRGRQMAARLCARCTSKPKPDDWSEADVVVLVKRALFNFAHQARDCGRTLVWDVLDIWAQPEANHRTVPDLAKDIADSSAVVGVDVLIGATKAMADDIGGVYLPHHSRPGLLAVPIRKAATTVAYEGSPRYLGSWRLVIEQACADLGLTFVINPDTLAEADIIVAFRGEQWDGEGCRRWKSGVKLVNAIAAGRPIITQFSSAFVDIQPPGTLMEEQRGLVDALRSWLPADRRQEALERCQQLAPAFTIDAVADHYREILRRAK